MLERNDENLNRVGEKKMFDILDVSERGSEGCELAESSELRFFTI